MVKDDLKANHRGIYQFIFISKRNLYFSEITRVKSVHHAFIQIYKEGGLRGLWRGSVVNVQRASLVSLGGSSNFLKFTSFC